MLRFVPRDARPMDGGVAAALSACGSVTARLLYVRGIKTAEEAHAFLNPGMHSLHNPYLMSGMEKAVAILTRARDEKLPTVVYGDYDADGTCACSLMTLALRRFGVNAEPHIPLRAEGYGLNEGAVYKLAQAYRVLVTVDLGITNHQEIKLAQSLGMTVIVTDHHGLGLVPCPADAVLNPLLGDYPFRRLCGAGVAFKVAQALLGEESCGEFLDLAALATVADIVPLTGENRALVAMGLARIQKRERPGVRALLCVSGDPPTVDADTLGFRLGPRLNAAGRLSNAMKGVCLLTTGDLAEAERLAAELDELNTLRKAEEARLFEAAEAAAREHDFLSEKALIVRGEGWHVGVIGLAAGRLCQKYHCPACVLSEHDGLLHGSLRSVPGVHIHECLKTCDDLLLRYGGHELAAGVTLKAENFDAFCRRLNEAVAKADNGCFVPSQLYDAEVGLADCTPELEATLRKLAPFGEGNPAPLLLARSLVPEERRAVGADGAHLKLTLRDGDRMLGGIAFSMGGMAARMPPRVDAVFSLGLNTFRGETALQMNVKALEGDAQARRAAFAQPDGDAEAMALLTAIKHAAQAGKSAADGETLPLCTREALEAALSSGERGRLFVARTNASALAALALRDMDVFEGAADDPRCFSAVLTKPDISRAGGFWRHVWLLDGQILPGEAALWRERLPNAALHAPPPSAALCALAASLDAGDEKLRDLYRTLRSAAWPTPGALARNAGLTVPQTWCGLHAFEELGLITLDAALFRYTLLPSRKCSLNDSPTLGRIRLLAGKGERA